MLETIREFAEEQLVASGEADDVRAQHAAYFIGFAERYRLADLLPDGDRVLGVVEAEHANLRAALTWLDEAGEAESYLRLAAALGRFWSAPGALPGGARLAGTCASTWRHRRRSPVGRRPWLAWA